MEADPYLNIEHHHYNSAGHVHGSSDSSQEDGTVDVRPFLEATLALLEPEWQLLRKTRNFCPCHEAVDVAKDAFGELFELAGKDYEKWVRDMQAAHVLDLKK